MKTFENCRAHSLRLSPWLVPVGLAGLLVLAPAGAYARDDTQAEASKPAPRTGAELSLGTTSVSGNRELPRVMVVVPWKSAEPARLGGRPIVSLVEEALTPVEPEVFRRRLDYYALLHGGSDGEDGKSTMTATNLTEE